MKQVQLLSILGVIVFLSLSFISYKVYKRFMHEIGIIKSNIATVLGNQLLIADNQNKDLYTQLVDHLKVFDVITLDKNPLRFERIGRQHDGGYVVPLLAAEKSDVLMGYGICDDISFEEAFIDRFNKQAYGFDCGMDITQFKNPKVRLIKECIGTDRHIYTNQKSSGRFSSFTEQLDKLKLTDANIFIKMDIEGAEYDVFDDILRHAPRITGIVLEIHFVEINRVSKALELMKKLSKDFYLVHIHGNNWVDLVFDTPNAKGEIPKVIELSFINKNLTYKATVHPNQKHPRPIDSENCPHKQPHIFEIAIQ